MAVSWNTLTLDDVCTKITDGAHHSPKSVTSGKPMASVKDMTPFGIKLDTCRLISEQDYIKLIHQGCKPEVDDILIAKDGNSALDTVCRVREELDAVLLSSVAILRPDKSKIDPEFLRLYLDAEPTRRYLKSSSISGAAIPRVILKDFKRANIKLPKMSDQIAIADVVNSYDLLIENNNRRISILEEMAQSLYREWFVKFRFPGNEQYQMVDSPLGLIPEGWAVKTLKESIELAYGKALKKADRKGGEVAVYGSGGIGGFHNTALVNGPCIIVGRKGNVGSIFWCEHDCWPIDTVFYVKSEHSKYYLYFNLLHQTFHNSDAAVPGLNRESAYSNKLILPGTEVVAKFDEILDPMFSQLKNLRARNENLKKQRDLLLPKLISGQIDLSQAEQALA